MNDTLERTDWWVYTGMKSTCNTLNPPTWFMQFITLNSFTSWHTQYLSEEPMVAHAAMTSVALMLCVCVLELFVMRLTGFVCLTYICLRTYPGRISILLLDIPTSVVLFTRWVIRTPNRPWTVEAVCVTFWDKTSTRTHLSSIVWVCLSSTLALFLLSTTEMMNCYTSLAQVALGSGII